MSKNDCHEMEINGVNIISGICNLLDFEFLEKKNTC